MTNPPRYIRFSFYLLILILGLGLSSAVYAMNYTMIAIYGGLGLAITYYVSKRLPSLSPI